jgi:hypothetical protein
MSETMSAEEAWRRIDELRRTTEAVHADVIGALMHGVPPQQIAGAVLAEWKRFEEQATCAPETLAFIRQRTDADVTNILAWPGGRYADDVLSRDDELAAIYRARFGADPMSQP